MGDRMQKPERCARCGEPHLYFLRKRNTWLCSSCKHEVGWRTGTVFANGKKPREWYQRIIDLHRSGVNKRQIAIQMGCDYSAIHRFLAKWIAENGPTEPAVRRVDYRNVGSFVEAQSHCRSFDAARALKR